MTDNPERDFTGPPKVKAFLAEWGTTETTEIYLGGMILCGIDFVNAGNIVAASISIMGRSDDEDTVADEIEDLDASVIAVTKPATGNKVWLDMRQFAAFPYITLKSGSTETQDVYLIARAGQ